MVRNANQEHKERLNTFDKVAIFITKIVGTMWCAIAFTVLALIGLPYALSSGTGELITWIVQTFLQLVLLSVILAGQNLQNRYSELRAEADYENNLNVKKDAEILMKRLNNLEKNKLDKIIQILEKE
ncbi:MAG: hypothetical protein WC822_06960 [Candidatus Paceibacterota bacterium]|jgi:uncharacterized membrane protein